MAPTLVARGASPTKWPLRRRLVEDPRGVVPVALRACPGPRPLGCRVPLQERVADGPSVAVVEMR